MNSVRNVRRIKGLRNRCLLCRRSVGLVFGFNGEIDERATMATKRKKLLPARTLALLLASLFVFDCLALSKGEWIQYTSIFRNYLTIIVRFHNLS